MSSITSHCEAEQRPPYCNSQNTLGEAFQTHGQFGCIWAKEQPLLDPMIQSCYQSIQKHSKLRCQLIGFLSHRATPKSSHFHWDFPQKKPAVDFWPTRNLAHAVAGDPAWKLWKVSHHGWVHQHFTDPYFTGWRWLEITWWKHKQNSLTSLTIDVTIWLFIPPYIVNRVVNEF